MIPKMSNPMSAIPTPRMMERMATIFTCWSKGASYQSTTSRRRIGCNRIGFRRRQVGVGHRRGSCRVHRSFGGCRFCRRRGLRGCRYGRFRLGFLLGEDLALEEIAPAFHAREDHALAEAQAFVR